MLKNLLTNKFFLLALMLFLHVFADFHLQGILANMKQISWWKEQVDSKDFWIYKHDWAVALLAHSFEWAFIIMFPVFLVYGLGILAAVILVLNTTIHFICDNIKCNNKTINLVADQTVHIGQIIFTWLVFTTFII